MPTQLLSPNPSSGQVETLELSTAVTAGLALASVRETGASTAVIVPDALAAKAPKLNPVFLGAVTAPVVNLSTLALVPTNDYNDAGRANTQIFGAIGTQAAPTTDKSAVGIWQKTSNYNTAGVNSTVYVSHVKLGNGGANEASALFGEAIDPVGGTQSSAIGVRGHAQLSGGALGNVIGGSFYATVTSGVTSIQNVVGAEVAIENLFSDAPPTYSTATMTAALLLGNTGSKRSDAAIITNPFTTVAFRNFLLATAGSVSDAVLRTLATTQYGIDLGSGSQTVAAIRTPNSLAQQAPTIDSRDSAPIVIPAGGNALLGAGAGGLFVVTNVTGQATAAFLGDAANSIVLIAGSPSWVASTKTPASGQTSVAFDGTTGLRIYNGFSSSQSFKVTSITQR